MGFSINMDWSEELNKNYDKWENLGRNQAEENCKHHTQDKNGTNMCYSGYCEECGFSEDSCMPMMNYAYPLEFEPSEEAIKKVIEETNLTVMYNNETEEYYLVLCGGGMDLSQDIALAYYYCQKWIPLELCLNVCTQPNLSLSGVKFRKMIRAVRESIKKDMWNSKSKLKDLNQSIKKSLQIDKKEVC